MGAGLPVVGTAVDGIAEQLTDETGMLVPRDDPDALAGAILELSRDPDLRRRLGAAAHQRVVSQFSLDRQARRLSDAYLATLREEPGE
jgi:glycosyltransferase involved in cell wall biosynthesis